MSATLEQAEAVEHGGLLRDAGILRASEKKANRDTAGLLRAEWRFLDALLLNGSASSDDAADDLTAKHDDGGHWLGGIFLRLSRSGLIVDIGSVRSCRPIRHRGKLTLWSIGQREAVERRRRDVLVMLNALTTKGTGSTGVTAEPDLNSTTQPTNGVNEHGQAV
ncbi:MAG: hypothetical protein ACKV2Q_11555 [Planctomycetaceae bacterium]